MSQNKALALLGVAKSTWQYRMKPRARAQAPVPHRDRPHPAKLTDVEYTTVADLLRNSSVSVSETYYRHLDSGGGFVASESTFYRVAKAEGIRMARTGPGRKRARGAGQAVMPQLCATGPGQVVCWDISFLPGLYRGHRYALYLVIDLFSRKIVGWTIEDAEDEIRACDLVELVVDAHRSTIVTVHSDNGAAMTSQRMKAMLESKKVELSTIRPGVSNDNAQIESAFRTVKYGPGRLGRECSKTSRRPGNGSRSMFGSTTRSIIIRRWRGSLLARCMTDHGLIRLVGVRMFGMLPGGRIRSGIGGVLR